MDEEIIVPVAFFMLTAVLGIGIPLVRGLVRRWDRETERPRSLPDSDARLERIEQAVEAMAIEVERISEGQRYVTRLLAERPQEPVARLREGQEAPASNYIRRD